MSREELKELQEKYHSALREYMDTRYDILDVSTESRDKVKSAWHKYYLARHDFRLARDREARQDTIPDRIRRAATRILAAS